MDDRQSTPAEVELYDILRALPLELDGFTVADIRTKIDKIIEHRVREEQSALLSDVIIDLEHRNDELIKE